MKKLLMSMFLVLSACAMQIEPATDADPQDEVEGIEQEAWCFGFPYRVMAFPVNQGQWKGDVAGQNMQGVFWNNACYAPGTDQAYVQDDGEINLIMNVGWPYSTCSKISSNIVQCNGQAFVCPATACLTEPVTWQLENTAPNNTINWGYSRWSAISSTLSAAPGNHNIWPKVPTQCTTAAPTIQFTPNGTGGATLACKYPMPLYWLHQN